MDERSDEVFQGWKVKERKALTAAVARFRPHNTPAIARALRTKSIADVQALFGRVFALDIDEPLQLVGAPEPDESALLEEAMIAEQEVSAKASFPTEQEARDQC
eukprot:m.178903 g.178903  ORF g.178903 m.178903 type:complete len:104 (-) comp53408_c0_seq4:419-730(-)